MYHLTGGDISKEKTIRWNTSVYAAYAYANTKAFQNRPRKESQPAGVTEI